jgi:hypothetical protein
MAGIAKSGPGGLEGSAKIEGGAWTAHPFRHRPGRGILVLSVVIVVAIVLGWWMRSPFWGIFAALALLLSLEAFFLPTRYEIGAGGMQVRKVFSSSVVDWARVRRVYEDKNGLTLSPFRRRTFMEPYRSTRILFDGGDRERIRAGVRGFLRPGSEWIDPRGRCEEVQGGADRAESA